MPTVTLLNRNSDNKVAWQASVSGNVVSAVTILLSMKNASGTYMFTNQNISGDYIAADQQYLTKLTNSQCSGTAGTWFLERTWTFGDLTLVDTEEAHIVERELKYASYSDVVNRDPQRLGPNATTSATVVNIDMLYRYALDTESEVDAAFDAADYTLPLTDDNALEYARLAASYGAASKALNAWFPTRVGEYGFNGTKFESRFDEMLDRVISGIVTFSSEDQTSRALPTLYGADEDDIWFPRDQEF